VNTSLVDIKVFGTAMSDATRSKIEALARRNAERPADTERAACSALCAARRIIMVQPMMPALVVDAIIVHAAARCGEYLTVAQRHAIIALARVRPMQQLSRDRFLSKLSLQPRSV